MNDSTWTWMGGSNAIEQPGIYGEKGNASIENVPGARREAVGWYDSSSQEFWLLGGLGFGNESNTVGSCWHSLHH